MIVPVMAISNLVLTRQIYSEETNGAHAHYLEPVPLRLTVLKLKWLLYLVSGSSIYYKLYLALSKDFYYGQKKASGKRFLLAVTLFLLFL